MRWVIYFLSKSKTAGNSAIRGLRLGEFSWCSKRAWAGFTVNNFMASRFLVLWQTYSEVILKFCPIVISQLQLGVDGMLLQDSTPQIKLPELRCWKMLPLVAVSHPVPQSNAQNRQALACLMLKTTLASMSTEQTATPIWWTKCCRSSRNSTKPWCARETSHLTQELILTISEACGALGWTRHYFFFIEA